MFVPHDNTILAYKIFVDVEVALHVALEKSRGLRWLLYQ